MKTVQSPQNPFQKKFLQLNVFTCQMAFEQIKTECNISESTLRAWWAGRYSPKPIYAKTINHIIERLSQQN